MQISEITPYDMQQSEAFPITRFLKEDEFVIQLLQIFDHHGGCCCGRIEVRSWTVGVTCLF